MKLFIDTHSELITIGVQNNNKIYKKEKISEYNHSSLVLPLIKELFYENKIDIKEIKEIIVVNGPGSFTGIRIGLVIAKTMAYLLDIDIKTVSSLTAYLISNVSNEEKLCVIKDNKGYYQAVFDKNNKPVIEEHYSENKISNYKEVDLILDINKIIEYSKLIPKSNYHDIKANYVKKIGVEL